MSNRRTHDETLKEHGPGEEMQEQHDDSPSSSVGWHERYPTRQAVLAAVKADAMVLKGAPDKIRGDPEILLEAIRKYEGALDFATHELRVNRDFVWQAVRLNCCVLGFVPPEILGDRDFFIKLFREEEGHGHLLQYASEELRNDREVVLAAVHSHADALQYASPELRGDREIALAAVSKDGATLQYASEEIRGDREAVLVAIRNNAAALEFASRVLLFFDREIALLAVRKRSVHQLMYVSDELRGDREFMLMAIRSGAQALTYASPDLLGDEEVVTEAVTKDGAFLPFASRHLREKPSIIGLALCHSGRTSATCFWTGPSLKTKLRLVLQVLQQEIPGDFRKREYLEDFESIQRCSNHWRRRAFEKVCLLWKISRENGVSSDQYETILDFWDAKLEFQTARDIEYCAPVLEAFGQKKCSFSEAKTMLD